MAAPPVPPRPFEDYDQPPPSSSSATARSSPPPLPPLPPDFKPDQDQYSSSPHFEHPLVAPRPHKLQPDLPMNMAASLDEQTTSPSFQPGQVVDFSAFPRPMSNPPFASSQPPPPLPAAHQQSLGFPPPKGPPLSRGPSPLSPLQGSDWSPWSPPPPSTATPSFPQPFAPALSPSHQHRPSLSSSFANLTLDPGAPSPRASPPAPSVPRDGPPALTAPLPTVAILSVQQVAIQQPNADPARRIAWCKDVLALVDRAQQLLARTDSNSTDPTVGPAQINDPELQQLVNVAIPIILQVSSQAQQGPIPPYVAEAIYMRATCAATGIYPQFIPHDPRTAFRDFERAAKAGYHAAWFKLGREYENFNDVQHAKECFERGMRHGVETCYYRLGMAHLMGQLGFQPDPKAALPLLHRAATLATIEVPQPAYVYGLLLLNEFSHVSIPPHLFQPFLPPGVTLQEEARKHLERAAYLNFAPAQYKLGHAYEFATPPFPFDPLLSVQYYSLASQQGEIEADMALSKWFLCGAEGAFDKDEGLAWTFAEKAARKGLPSAEFALGYYAEVGIGGPKNIDTARKWYERASQHGNTDATERLQALSHPSPQALSREEHETLTDAKLVRRRTQAKQRSEALAGTTAPPPIPAAQRSQIVNNIRKNSMKGSPTAAGPFPYGAAAGATGSPAPFGAPHTSSPPGMGVPARLPPVDPLATAPRRASGPASMPGPPGGAPVPQSFSASPRPLPSSPAVNSPQRPFPNAQRYSLVDPGSSSGAAQSPRPPHPQQPAGTPPLRRPGGAALGSPANAPAPLPQSGPDPAGGAPARPRPSKGPQTFEEMGIPTQRVDEGSNCVIM